MLQVLKSHCGNCLCVIFTNEDYRVQSKSVNQKMFLFPAVLYLPESPLISRHSKKHRGSEGLSIVSYIVTLVVSVHTQICGTICTRRENGGYRRSKCGVSHKSYMVTCQTQALWPWASNISIIQFGINIVSNLQLY